FVRGVQYTFTALFTVELLMRLVAFGFRRMFCEEDWIWSALDVVIVVSSLWETALDILSSNTNTNISALRAFRIIRLTKILRTMRLIRIFRFVN
ncbi:Cacna1h, partial [Symbiodinium sp. CCMP2456]